MAEVFISHAAEDVDRAARLSDLVARAGYSVWWDRELLSGDHFQPRIQEELANAAAVVVLWSASSVGSEWVYSEARRSHDRAALVQLRERGVGIDDLPAPFDTVHCPYVDDVEGLLRAVAARVDAAGGPRPTPPVTAATLTLLHAGPANAAGRAGFAAICAKRGGHRFAADNGALAAWFESAPDAVRAAVELAAAEPSLGLGLHTGTPTRHEDGFIGLDAQRVARIAAAAADGQVLLSETTAALVTDLPELAVLDLGTHRFAELPRPEHLHQASAPGAPAAFPPIVSLGSVSGLPRQTTSFVGREADLAEVVEALSAPAAGLVTVLGTGGMGKTRLALAVAEQVAPRFADGVYFVPLEHTTTDEGTWAAIAAALGLPETEAAPDGVARALGTRAVLLVLDNLEQLPAAGAVVSRLLDRCPAVRALATSRRPLHVSGEHEIALGPLDLQSDAVARTTRRAALVRRGFRIGADNSDDVLAICRALDGLPLAIELAAARTRLLSPAALRRRLGEALDVTAADGSRPDRQRTLRRTLEWSHDLLDDEQRRVFRLLGVFPAGARLDAVEAVAAAIPDPPVDAIAELHALAEACLLAVVDDPRGEPRVHLLNTTREFAREQLSAAGELDAAMAGLARWCHRLFADTQRWTAPSTAEWARRVGIPEELGTVRAALEWLFADARDDLTDVRLELATRALPYSLGPLAHTQALAWLRAAATQDTGASPLSRAEALLALAWESIDADQAASLAWVEEGQTLLRGVDPAELGSGRGLRTRLLGEEMAAVRLARTGNLAAAADLLAALLDEEVPVEQRLELTTTLSGLRAELGDPAAALELERAASATARSIGNLGLALILETNSGCSLRELGRLDEARATMEAAIPLMLSEATPARQLAVSAEDYAAVLVEVGRATDAALLWGAASALRAALGIPMSPAQVTETRAVPELGRATLGSGWDAALARGGALDLASVLDQVVAGTATPEPLAASREGGPRPTPSAN